MKKTTFAFILLTFSAFSFTNKNTNDPNPKDAAIIGKAKTALKNQCSESGANLCASVKNVSMCYGDNYTTEVTFFKSENKSAVMVAKITLDCNKEVISVNCNN